MAFLSIKGFRRYYLSRNISLLAIIYFSSALFSWSGEIIGILKHTELNDSVYSVCITDSNHEAFILGQEYDFKVSKGDQSKRYLGLRIKAHPSFFGNEWHLERIFPINGSGSKAYYDLNKIFSYRVKSLSRRKFLEEDDYILSFAGINHKGEFFQFNDFLGKILVVNFIFTRCRAAEMCPAATLKMARMQDEARDLGLIDLHFLSISFDPDNDSPGVLNAYAQSYGIESDTFTFMTAGGELIEDLMRYFGIITMEEDGTINHTMATLLINQKGRVHYRKEGSVWQVSDFLERARELVSE